MGGRDEGVRASRVSHRTRSSSVHVLYHHSLQDAAACVVDTQQLQAVVASSLDLDSAGTSSQDDPDVGGPRLRVP